MCTNRLWEFMILKRMEHWDLSLQLIKRTIASYETGWTNKMKGTNDWTLRLWSSSFFLSWQFRIFVYYLSDLSKAMKTCMFAMTFTASIVGFKFFFSFDTKYKNYLSSEVLYICQHMLKDLNYLPNYLLKTKRKKRIF